jgi:hypothetical protein
MSLFDRFFSRAPQAPLPELPALLEACGLPLEIPGLLPLIPSFEAHRDPLEREAWVAALAVLHRGGLPLPPSWDVAQENLLPELVPSWKAEREGRWSRPFIDGLSQRLRLETAVVPAPWLKLWDQSADDALERALDNLRHRTEGSFERMPSGIYRGSWRDGLDAARLLLPEVWDGVFKDQHPFLAIPTAGTFLAAPQILLPKLMDAVGKTLADGAEILQAAILERVGDQLMTARIQEPHPMAAPQKEFKQIDLVQALRVQEEDLDPALGRPAPVLMLKTQKGMPLTAASWVAGTPVLLPEVDLVAFIGPQGEPLGLYARQTLPRIFEIKGEAVDIWGPRRVRYDGFPTAEQLSRLECFATGEQMKSLQTQAPGPARSQAPSPAQRPATSTAVTAGGPFNTQPTPSLPRHLHGAGLGVQDGD